MKKEKIYLVTKHSFQLLFFLLPILTIRLESEQIHIPASSARLHLAGMCIQRK